MQTDPIGYKDNLNLYAYVGNDPVNRSDPTGMFERESRFDCGGAKVWSACGGTIVPQQGASSAKAADEKKGPIDRAIKGATDAYNSAADAVNLAKDAVDSVTIDEEEIDDTLWYRPKIPRDAYRNLDLYRSQGYQFRSGQHFGHRRFSNIEGHLPQGGDYREMRIRQIDPFGYFWPESQERIVVDRRTGEAWYTNDHYKSFRKM